MKNTYSLFTKRIKGIIIYTKTLLERGKINMDKVATFTYGEFILPTGRTLRDFYIKLIRSDDVVVLNQKVVYGEPSVTISVPNGTGWRVEVTNFDDLGQPVSVPVVSTAFDVVVPVNIIVGVSVA